MPRHEGHLTSLQTKPVIYTLLRCTSAAGSSRGAKIKHLRRTTSGSADNGLGTTAKYLRKTTSGAAGNGLCATIKYLQRTTSGAVGSGLSTTAKYLRRTTRQRPGRHDQVPATQNERRRGQRPILGITYLPNSIQAPRICLFLCVPPSLTSRFALLRPGV
jgi:hypothetical protein